MLKNNIIIFPTPKKPSSQSTNNQTDSRVKTNANNKAFTNASPSEGKIIPLQKGQKLSPQTNWKDNPISKVKKPSYNPYKDWFKKQNKKPDNLIDGKTHWPVAVPTPSTTPKQSPYVFAGTGLSFLLVAMALLVSQGNNKKTREIATDSHYHPPIKIIKDNKVKHNVVLYKNEYGKLAVSLISDNNRDLASLSAESQAQIKNKKDLLLHSQKKKKEDRRPNATTKTVKQVWRAQEQRALYLIKTGQRKIINIGQTPHH